MNKPKQTISRTMWFSSALALVLLGARPGAAQAPIQSGQAPAPASKTAGEVFKNIQVLKAIPADELLPSMQFISASLGVGCNFCHVEGAFEKDDKRPKQTARKMIAMEFAINRENFSGHTEVTCYSCHRGATHPVGTPVLAAAEPKPEAAEAMNPGSAPTPDQLLGKYVEALGGAEAIHRISTRVEKGTLTVMGREMPVEVYAKAPDKRLSIVQGPRGASLTAYDGHSGWLGNAGRPPREISGAELAAARLDAAFYLASDLKQQYPRLRAGRPEKIDDHVAYVVLGFAPGQPFVKLYFDPSSGLLLRLERETATPLGPLPAQVDYGDYRAVGGVKVPFRWTISRPGGAFTIQVHQVQQNVPIDDHKFSLPAASAASGGKAGAP